MRDKEDWNVITVQPYLLKEEKKGDISVITVQLPLKIVNDIYLYDATSSSLMTVSRLSSEFTNLISLCSCFSYTCLESV